MQHWMRAGPGKPAHWIRMFGTAFFTTSCREILPRENTQEVKTEQVGYAGAPGRHYWQPLDGEICEVCLAKARNDA
jgi:hypothetical protein